MEAEMGRALSITELDDDVSAHSFGVDNNALGSSLHSMNIARNGYFVCLTASNSVFANSRMGGGLSASIGDKKGRQPRLGPFLFWTANLGWFAPFAALVHPITVSVAAGRSRRNVAFRNLDHHCLGGEEETGNRGCVLKCRPGHLGWVDNAGLHQILVHTSFGVVAKVLFFRCEYLAHHNCAFFTGIAYDLAQRLFEGPANDLRAGFFVTRQCLDHAVYRRNGANQGHAAAGYDAFLDCRTGGMQRVLDARLFLLQLRFGGSAHLDDGNTAHQLGQPLLQLLLVVVRRRLLDL